jgi:hypothetical protein
MKKDKRINVTQNTTQKPKDRVTRTPLIPWGELMCSRKVEEEFKDIKGGIRIGISKKNRQHNVQKNKYKRTNNDLQSIRIKLKTE